MKNRQTDFIAAVDATLAELAVSEKTSITFAQHDNEKRAIERARRIVAVERAPFGLLRNEEHRHYHGLSWLGALADGIGTLLSPAKRQALETEDTQLAALLQRVDKNAETLLNNWAIDAANGRRGLKIPAELKTNFDQRVAAHVFLDTPARQKPKKERSRHV